MFNFLKSSLYFKHMVSGKLITQSLTVFQLFCLQVLSRCWHSLFHHPCEQLSISATFCQRVQCNSIINSKVIKMFYMFLFINNSDNNTMINNTRQQVHFVHAYTTRVVRIFSMLMVIFGGFSYEKNLKSKLLFYEESEDLRILIQTQNCQSEIKEQICQCSNTVR